MESPSGRRNFLIYEAGASGSNKEKASGAKLSACRENNACLFLVADQPWIRCHTIEALIRMYTESEKGMAAAAKMDSLEIPVFFRKILPGSFWL